MPSTNCMEGLRCPKCWQEDYVKLEATSMFLLTDEGTEEHYDVSYNGDSYCECPDCLYSGNLCDFFIETQPVKREEENG